MFSGTIISSIIKNGDIKRTAEYQLLLGAIALPGRIMNIRNAFYSIVDPVKASSSAHGSATA